MTSDKRKGSNAKSQSTTAKPSLKQSTLFHSFLARPSVKSVPANEPLPDEGGNAAPSLASQSEVETATTSNQDITVEVSEKKPIEIVEIEDSPPNNVVTLPDLPPNSRRSPSVFIVEDTPEPLPVQESFPTADPPRSQTSPLKASVEGISMYQPIVIPPSPIKAPAETIRSDKSVHPFFAQKQKRTLQSPAAAPPGARSKAPEASSSDLPPFPDKFSLHVRGTQTAFPATPLTLPLRPPRNPNHILDESFTGSYDFLKKSTTSINADNTSPPPTLRVSPSSPETLASIPEEIKSAHPAIARLANLKPEDLPHSHRPWTDKWRPSCAQEVLGNEQSAIYLRDWLRALELQLENKNAETETSASTKSKSKSKAARGTKRPRVVRAVDKTRRKKSRLDSDEEDNWIAYSDEEEEDEIEQFDSDGFDDFGEIRTNNPPSSPASSVHEASQASAVDKPQPAPAPNLGQLHNTVLLVGPSGSGKTASVYACAEELGWDVFEVYPGIGRRNSSNVENLIGEVGKNHLVVQNRLPTDALKSFLRSKGKRKAGNEDDGSDALSQFSPRKKANNIEEPRHDMELSNGSTTRSVRQSLILLEEVDILFKEDGNFWPAVINIIRECKRPVICTCNDISLVPTYDLPLQTTLTYQPCPKDIAAYYLRALCASEGYSLDRDALVGLYSDRDEPERVPDLRATINALQVLTSHSVATPDAPILETPAAAEGTRASLRCAETLSFFDGDLERDVSARQTTAAGLAGHVPSEDDELGHGILHDLHGKEPVPAEVYDRQREMISAGVGLARGIVGVKIMQGAMEMLALEERKRRIHHGQMIAAREVCAMEVWARQDGSISTEYVPYVRQMVAEDDRLETVELAKGRGIGRATRNSYRASYTRIYRVSDAGRDGLMAHVEGA